MGQFPWSQTDHKAISGYLREDYGDTLLNPQKFPKIPAKIPGTVYLGIPGTVYLIDSRQPRELPWSTIRVLI